jgi:excisionase family DNA binding protein
MKQESERTGLGVRTIKRAIADAEFPHIKLGRRVLFDPELSDQYLAERTFRGRAARLANHPVGKAA